MCHPTAGRSVGLDLDDKDAGVRDDDNEVGLALDLTNMVGDGKRVEHEPLSGVLAVAQDGIDGLLPRRCVVRAKRRNHSSH